MPALDSIFSEIREIPTAAGRVNFMRNQWDTLLDCCIATDRTWPRNDNTYSGTLVTEFLADMAITKLQNRWAPLAAFARDFTPDPIKPRATVEIKNVTVGPTVQTNATNFESGDTTIAAIPVTVNHISASSHVTNDQLNSGLRLENLLTITLASLADQVIQVATDPITTTTFTATPLVAAPATFQYSDLQTLWAQLKKSPIKNLVLDGEYLARIINQPTYYQEAGPGPGAGFKGFGWDFIALNTNWVGNGGISANVKGFACNPQAIGCVAGLPMTATRGVPGVALAQNIITLPGVNISIQSNYWFALASRTAWISYDLMFGAAAGDTTAGIVIKSS